MDYAVKTIYGKTTEKPAEVTVPGSKSITARALLLAAVSGGETVLHGAQFSNDCLTFMSCLQALGIQCRVEGEDIRVAGCGGRLAAKSASINVGSAGTAARFLPAFLAFQDGIYELHASPQMERRPIRSLLDSLQAIGAKITYLGEEGCYPFIIQGTTEPAAEAEIEIGDSSQFLSGLLIASTCAPKGMQISYSGTHGMDYVKMTVSMMRSFGFAVLEQKGSYTVSGLNPFRNEAAGHVMEYAIEPDMSAAAYFYAANRILGTNIQVKGASAAALQGDSNFIRMLPAFDGGEIDMSSFSDQALTLAAIAPFLSNPTHITGVSHIRKQECDRIAAICSNLTAMGIRNEEHDDGVSIWPGTPKPAGINTFGDHRVAMAFAITGLRAPGIIIRDAEVCSKTFKDFFKVLDDVCNRLTGDK